MTTLTGCASYKKVSNYRIIQAQFAIAYCACELIPADIRPCPYSLR